MTEVMESREYSIEEIAEIAAGKNKKSFAFICAMSIDDHLYEDAAMLRIAMPRGFWKILYGAAKSNGCDISEIASELLGDHLWEIWEASQKTSVSPN